MLGMRPAAQSAMEWVNCALGIQRYTAAMNGKEAGTYPRLLYSDAGYCVYSSWLSLTTRSNASL
jgi:hypothetical protein